MNLAMPKKALSLGEACSKWRGKYLHRNGSVPTCNNVNVKLTEAELRISEVSCDVRDV